MAGSGLTRVAQTPPRTRLVLAGPVHLSPLGGWRHLSILWKTAAWPSQPQDRANRTPWYPSLGPGVQRGS